MPQATLDAFGIVVQDLRVAVTFYRRLGVPFPDGAEDSPHGHAEAQVGGLRFMLDTVETMRAIDPNWEAPSGTPRSSIALNCGAPGQVDALYSEAIAVGAQPYREPWDAFWGQRYAQLRDPDGNAVDLYADASTD